MGARQVKGRSGYLFAVAAVALLTATAVGPPALRHAHAALGDCAQPVSNGDGPVSSDCLFVLKAAVGTVSCDVCVCDVDNGGAIVASDALACLKIAVGGSVPLNCPPCTTTTTTTTTTESTTSTSSTSSTSSTTLVPVPCLDDDDCDTEGGFRCNPHLDECERPCASTDDCRLFFECNTKTGFCFEP